MMKWSSARVKEALEKVEYVSTTVDMWTAHNRSFLGMTEHWIDPVTLHRCKAALACTRVTGRHTYDVLGARIEQIHNFYGLAGKITATITDNGSNFVKAFSLSSFVIRFFISYCRRNTNIEYG